MSGVGITGLIENLPGTVTPYPVFEDVNGLGGFRVVTDNTARDAIHSNFRKVGMEVYSVAAGKQYQLIGGTLDANWVESPLTLLQVSRIDAGNTGGAKLVDIPTTGLASGTLASVASVGSVFWLQTNASAALLATVDGITIVQSTATSTSVWVRESGVTNPIFAATPPLFIDPTLGSDDNDGLASGVNALKTADEWSRRMDGQNLTGTANVTVTCAAGAVGSFDLKIALRSFIFIVGTYTAGATGTISAIVAENSATNTEYQFTGDVGVTDGDRLIIVSSATPANVGGTGYVKGFAAGGASNPYCTQFCTVNGVGFFPAAGDTYAAANPTTIINGIAIQTINPDHQPAVNAGLAFIGIQTQLSRFSDFKIGSNIFETNSNFGNYFIQSVFNDSFSTIFNACFFRSYGCDFKVGTAVTFGTVNFHIPCFRAGLAVAPGQVGFSGGVSYFDGSVATVNISSASSGSNSGDICWSRNTSLACMLVQQGGRWHNALGQFWSPVQGARNACVAGVQIFAGGAMTTNFFSGVAGIIGSLGNVVCETEVLSQFSAIESSGSFVTEASLGTGSVIICRDTAVGSGGIIPANSPTVGSERYSVLGGQYGRGSGGAVTSVVPAGSLTTNTHAKYAQVTYSSASVSTVGAAAQFIVQVNINNPAATGALNNLCIYVEAIFTGFDSTNGNAVAGKISRTFKVVAGALSAVGATNILSAVAGDASLTGSTLALTASGSAIFGSVTGVAGVTISWNCDLTFTTTEFVG